MGGLGNQLFQYAMSRRIAYFEDSPIKLDPSEFQDYNLRKYRLSYFNIIENIASPDEIASLKKSRNKKMTLLALGLIDKIQPYYWRSFIKERHFHFDPNMLKVSGNAYLEGYWQSEKYFKDIENIIRSEFTLKHNPDPLNKEIAQKIMDSDSVSIHIRRGDYVLNAAINQFHGTCSLDYYYQAIDKIKTVVHHPHFFVFSDEPKWVQESLKIEDPVTFIAHNGPDKDYQDLWLMSLCRHHIIANSTFSWWGAWLCTNKDKKIFAPERWFNSSKHNTDDLIPEAWNRI